MNLDNLQDLLNESDTEELENELYELEIGEAKKLIAPFVEQNHPAAIRIDCSMFEEGVSEDEMDRTYAEGMMRAADLGDLRAIYLVGALYDTGESDYVPFDPNIAAGIFKKAADLGHAHSMWIHACDLIWGRSSVPKSVEEGIQYLDKSIEAGSSEGCITKARFLINGELGHEIDLERANELRARAIELDETTFDPFQ